MIVHLNKNISKEAAQQLAEKYQSILFENGKLVLVTPSKLKTADEELKKAATEIFVADTDIQLASKQYIATKRELVIGDLVIGGNTNNTLVITGPCSVESEEQIESAAQLCVELGVKVLRAGAYKPRTSPYTFQGLGLEGLKLLDKMRSKYGLKIITEVRDSTHADEVIEYADIIQIGAKSMYDHGILRKCGKTRKPVLLKRGFGTTLQEFVQSAEFILSGGNPNVMLCERGIRTFETKTRFTLDLCGAAWLKANTNLPIVLDPSHAIGYAYGVADLSRACVAMGIDGLLIESHPNPKVAKSDADQQLNFDEFRKLYASLKTVASAVGYKVVSAMDKYEQRGVSAGKEEVHAAVKDLYHGLYPKAFCKIYPDYLGNDDAFCNVMSSDGSGTKSILAYLYWKETGDISVWRGIAQDAIVMNLDDLLCVGAVDNFLYTSIINRNKNLITGEVIAEIIKGSKEFIERMNDFGVHIHQMGGETADLGDCVRTTTVDATMTVRMKKKNVVLTDNIQPGNVIIGLSSYGQATYEDEYNSGISSNGLTSARHDLLAKSYAKKYPETFDNAISASLVYSGSKKMTDELDGTSLNIGKALLSPTRTYTPVIKKILEEIPGKVNGIVNCTGGAHTKVLHYIENLRIVKNNLLPVPPLFKLIQKESKTGWKEMFKVLNCGTRLEIYCDEKYSSLIIDVAKSFGIAAQEIGYVEANKKNEVVIKSEYGEFVYL